MSRVPSSSGCHALTAQRGGHVVRAHFSLRRPRRPGHFSDQAAFTLVEMLIAVAITLIMMAAVVTIFANVTSSVRNRRATIEMSGQLRHVRNMLQQDLAAATCPGIPWQRPESNHGYIELIEGAYRDSNPSMLTDGDLTNGELDAKLSAIPRNNAVTDKNGNGRIDDEEIVAHLNDPKSLAIGMNLGLNGLGDYDDILMFTARNEHEHYVGRIPSATSAFDTGSSPLAEIIWFAVENPSQAENDLVGGFFGEPGMRTIYRRALIIAPWVNLGDGPGVVLLPNSLGVADVDRALASLISFQDTFDISARLEWDPFADGGAGRWAIRANDLADLTKRENRFGHYGFNEAVAQSRQFPFPVLSGGNNYPAASDVEFVDINGPAPGMRTIKAYAPTATQISSYIVQVPGDPLLSRPLAYVAGGTSHATANAMLDDDGRVVRVLPGPAPLSGMRRGQDVMLSNVLAFDLRVFDPGAPIYLDTATQTVLEPSDPGWTNAYGNDMLNVNDAIGSPNSPSYAFVGQGAYVDLGYAVAQGLLAPIIPSAPTLVINPWFATINPLGSTVPNYSTGCLVFDTWSTSYEDNGIDEDNRDGDNNPMTGADEGTNGLDDDGQFGPDDVGERETRPPYDKPLRGVQVVLRVYETDARQIRQVRVNQHFLSE